jgi:hypothetical protein
VPLLTDDDRAHDDTGADDLVPRIGIFRLDKRPLVFPRQIASGCLYCIWDYCINPQLWFDSYESPQWRGDNEAVLDIDIGV